MEMISIQDTVCCKIGVFTCDMGHSRRDVLCKLSVCVRFGLLSFIGSTIDLLDVYSGERSSVFFIQDRWYERLNNIF